MGSFLICHSFVATIKLLTNEELYTGLVLKQKYIKIHIMFLSFQLITESDVFCTNSVFNSLQ